VPLVLYVNIKVQVSVYTENTYFDDRACEDLGGKEEGEEEGEEGSKGTHDGLLRSRVFDTSRLDEYILEYQEL
jgi:hypothetical protein